MSARTTTRMTPTACIAAALVWLSHSLAYSAPGTAPRAGAGTTATAMDTSPEWRELSAPQKQVLKPLEALWHEMDDTRREKWVNVANRFGSLSPAERQRVQERMTEWAKLRPQERGEARLRFQQARQMSPEVRQQKWAAYQALPQETRVDLSRQAQRKAKPVFLADGVQGPREARQLFAPKRRPLPTEPVSAQKSNLVPNAAAGPSVNPTIVRPAAIKAGNGATTTLLGQQRPTPPAHQQTGMPKIAASKTFVDPVTLLPRKGAQSAAMASLPSTGNGLDTASAARKR